jgi:DNA-binding transcriptional MerR regulator
MAEESGPGVYSIGAIVKMLGIPAQTLRAWENRYGQIVPARSAGGQRLYSRDQVDQLCFVREQLDRGLQPADAHRLLAERGQERLDPRPSDGAPFMILVAERDPYVAEFAEYFLRTEGYVARVVFDAADVAQIIAGEGPDLLLVDLLISGGRVGLDLCRQARLGSIPVLAVSALDSRDEALEAGADAFLRKPLDPLQLVSTVRDLLGTSAYLRTVSGR